MRCKFKIFVLMLISCLVTLIHGDVELVDSELDEEKSDEKIDFKYEFTFFKRNWDSTGGMLREDAFSKFQGVELPADYNDRESWLMNKLGMIPYSSTSDRKDAILLILAPIIQSVLKFAFAKIDSSVETVLEDYSSETEAKLSMSFYERRNGNIVMPWTGMRFTKYQIGDIGENEKCVIDFIAQIRIAEGGDAFQMRPLRLFFTKPSVKGTEVVFSASLNVESVSFNGSKGVADSLFNQVLFSKKFAEGANEDWDLSVHYFGYNRSEASLGELGIVTEVDRNRVHDQRGWSGSFRLPLVSISDGSILAPMPKSDGEQSSALERLGFANTTFSFVELGSSRKKKFLEALRSILSDASEGLSESLKDAIVESLKDEEPQEDGDTSQAD